MAIINNARVNVRKVKHPIAVEAMLVAVGGVPNKQTYDAVLGEYAPDYAVGTPCTVRAIVVANDPTGLHSTNDGAAGTIGSIRWFEVVDGVRSEITAGTPGYNLSGEGWEPGTIQIKKNIDPEHPLTLIFSAQYLISDNGASVAYEIPEASILFESESITEGLPRIKPDVPGNVYFNPVTDTSDYPLHVNLFLAGRGLTQPGTSHGFVWEVGKKDIGGLWTWEPFDDAEPLMCDMTLSADTATMTLRRRLIPDGSRVRVRAWWLAVDGTRKGAGTSTDNIAPELVFYFMRRYGTITSEVQGMREVGPGAKSITYKVVMTDNVTGVIENPGNYFVLPWKFEAPGTGVVSSLGNGEKVVLDASKLDYTPGVVYCDAAPRSQDKVLTVGGKVLTVGGKILTVGGS